MAENGEDVFGVGAEEGDEFGLENAAFDLAEDGEEEQVVAETPVDDPYEALYKHHPEMIIRYAESIDPLVPLKAAPPGSLDERHKSPPFLTTYERTKILGTRANQLADGARPFINPASIPAHITQPLDIAKIELEHRVLPFIIERPMLDGKFEYWRLSDLLIL